MPTTANVPVDPKFGEEMLRQLFKNCDQNLQTGHVRAIDLINAIKGMVSCPDNSEDLSKLSSMLDVSRDNPYVTVEEFVRTGIQWLQLVQNSSDSDKENRCDTSIWSPPFHPRLSGLPRPLSTRQSAAQLKLRAEQGIQDLNETKCKTTEPDNIVNFSFGILEPSEMESSFNNYSIESDSVSAGFEHQRRENESLSCEVEDLRRQVQLLREDNESLTSQLHYTEDCITQIRQENDSLQCNIKNFKVSEEMAAHLMTKQAELDSAQLTCEKLSKDIESYEEKSKNLSLRNKSLLEELDKYQKDLIVSNENEIKLNVAMDELTQKLENMKLVNSDQTFTIKCLAEEKDSLIVKLNETQEINERLEAEIEEFRTQIIAYEQNEFTSGSCINPDKLFGAGDISVDNPEGLELNYSSLTKSEGHKHFAAGLAAFSTPFNEKFTKPFRGSIGDELKKFQLSRGPLFQNEMSLPNKENRDVSTQTLTQECYHSSSQIRFDDVFRKKSPNFMVSKFFIISGLAVIAFLAFFTFFGAIEYDNQVLYPVTWSPEFEFWEPFIIARFKSSSMPEVF